MEKYVTWYRLTMKAQMKKAIFWISLGGMVLLVTLVQKVTLPQKENMLVLICNEDGEGAEQLINSLEKRESIFTFERADSEEKLKEAVISGRAECGFVIQKGFEEKLIQGHQEKTVTYVGATSSAKGAIARESFYAAMFEMYSDRLLERSVSDIFQEENPDIVKEMLGKNHEYLESDKMFHVIVEKTEAEEMKSVYLLEKGHAVRGTVGLLIFLTMLMVRGQDLNGQGNQFQNNLLKSEKRKFLMIKYIASVTIQAFLGVVLIVRSSEAKTVIYEVGAMIIFIVSCGVWVLIFGKLFRKRISYNSWMFTLFVSNALLCPVFFKLGAFIPAVNVINWIFPLGVYLKMF